MRTVALHKKVWNMQPACHRPACATAQLGSTDDIDTERFDQAEQMKFNP